MKGMLLSGELYQHTNSVTPHAPPLPIHRHPSLCLLDPYSVRVSHLSPVTNTRGVSLFFFFSGEFLLIRSLKTSSLTVRNIQKVKDHSPHQNRRPSHYEDRWKRCSESKERTCALGYPPHFPLAYPEALLLGAGISLVTDFHF